MTALRALFMAKRLQLVDFSRTVTLGRHELFFSQEEYEYVRARSGLEIEYRDAFSPFSFQEELLSALGASEPGSIDASGYEGASIVHNFNERIPEDLRGRFSLFIDFGSMEHIFDVRQVINNIQLLLDSGGSAMILTDANGNSGHGLYQFSPEFFYSAFSERNGFSETAVLLIDCSKLKRWLLVKPPTVARERIELPASGQYLILCFTRKSAHVDGATAEQSDYSSDAWQQSNHQHGKQAERPSPQLALLSTLRSVDVLAYVRMRSLMYSIKRTRRFKKACHPVVPEETPKGPYETLTSVWPNGE